MSEASTAPTDPPFDIPAAPNPAVKEDELYFLRPVIIQVEDCLFKVPRYYLTRSSDIFKDMFSVPQGSHKEGHEGSSDKNPVILPGVKKDEFRRLLQVLLPLNIPPSFDTIPKDGWIAVLRLAKMWEIYDVRLTAITYLTKLQRPMTAVEKIVLAKEYYVEEWLRSGYEELVNRPSALSDLEAEEIGWKSALAVSRVREEVRPSGSYTQSSVPDAVARAFEAELKEVKAASKNYKSPS